MRDKAKEKWNTSLPRTVISHIVQRRERSTAHYEQMFATDLFILFVRCTVSHGLTKLGSVNESTAPSVRSFLFQLTSRQARQELYEILMSGQHEIHQSGQHNLLPPYSHYAINHGKLHAYDITEERMRKFHTIIAHLEARLSHYHSKKAKQKALKMKARHNALEYRFVQETKILLDSLCQMQFSAHGSGKDRYTLCSLQDNTLMVKPWWLHPEHAKDSTPDISSQRSIYIKSSPTETTRIKTSRKKIFIWLAQQEQAIISHAASVPDLVWKREAIFDESFYKQGVSNTEHLLTLIEQLCTIINITYLKQ